jgi:hypothetical protein
MKLLQWLIAGQQRKANLMVATQLQRTEFRNNSVEQVLYMVESGQIGEHFAQKAV